jgi:hypothetical protein
LPGKWLPLYSTKLSVIFDPAVLGFDSLRGQAALNGSVDLLVVSDPPRCTPLLAVDLSPAVGDRWRRHKRELLAHYGIPYCEDAEASDFVDPALSKTSGDWLDAAGRNAINRVQWDAVCAVSDRALSRGLICLHEVTLGEVIDAPGADQAFLNRSRLDAVICTRGPNAKPLVAIEYDSSFHDQPKQQENDQKKDAALLEAGLTLVRMRNVAAHGDTSAASAFGTRESRTVAWNFGEKQKVLNYLVERLADEAQNTEWALYQLLGFIQFEAEAIESDAGAAIVSYASEARGHAHRLLASATGRQLHFELSEAAYVPEADEEARRFSRLQELESYASADSYDWNSPQLRDRFPPGIEVVRRKRHGMVTCHAVPDDVLQAGGLRKEQLCSVDLPWPEQIKVMGPFSHRVGVWLEGYARHEAAKRLLPLLRRHLDEVLAAAVRGGSALLQQLR